MSRPLIGGTIALFMALTPALAVAQETPSPGPTAAQEAPSSGVNTTPAAKEENTTAPSTLSDSDPGRVGGGAGAGAGGAGAGGAGGAGGGG
jgi:hypothetical protein